MGEREGENTFFGSPLIPRGILLLSPSERTHRAERESLPFFLYGEHARTRFVDAAREDKAKRFSLLLMLWGQERNREDWLA